MIVWIIRFSLCLLSLPMLTLVTNIQLAMSVETYTQSDYMSNHLKGKYLIPDVHPTNQTSEDHVTFVGDVPDRYYCTNCKLGMKKPFVITQNGCGHNICWMCAQSLTREGQYTGLCPGDRSRRCTEFNIKQVREDCGLKRDMKTTMVYCQNVKQGCLGTMHLQSLDAHLNHCNYLAASGYEGTTDLSSPMLQPSVLMDILQAVNELKKKCQSLEEKNKTLEIKLQEVLKPEVNSEDSGNGTRTQCVSCSSSHVKKMGELVNLHDLTLGEFDVRLQCLENSSYNGTLIWRIRDFSEHVERAKSGKTLSLFSQPFYTSVHGYKMCGRLYPNGDGVGKGTHISLFIVIMRGTYDDLLQWPFQQKITLSLLDATGKHSVKESFAPNTKSSSFKKPVSEMNVASGCPTFFRQDKLNPFLVDNSLYLSIQVDTTGLEDSL